MFVSGVGTEQSEKLIILSDQNFKQQIKHGVVLVDFWAEWCQPCKIQGPIINQLAEENANEGIKIAKLDVEKNPKVSGELGIRNIPTMIVFKNGEIKEKLVGLKTKKVLEKTLQKFI